MIRIRNMECAAARPGTVDWTRSASRSTRGAIVDGVER